MRAMKNVIATRTLYQSAPRKKMSVLQIGKPQKVSDQEWRCPFHISNVGMSNIEFGHGIDALQSIIQAIEGSRVVLARRGTGFRWDGGDVGETGLPRYVPLMFGKKFAQRVNRMIDREIVVFARAAKARHKAYLSMRSGREAKKGK